MFFFFLESVLFRARYYYVIQGVRKRVLGSRRLWVSALPNTLKPGRGLGVRRKYVKFRYTPGVGVVWDSRWWAFNGPGRVHPTTH